MTRLRARLLCLCLFTLTPSPLLLAQDEPDLALLEAELIARPCFERPFYELLAETLDHNEWKALDARWQKKEKSLPRHRILRGMLAERQGDFDAALVHYQNAREDQWGAYHHARLLAFLGETKAAADALRRVVAQTREHWIFREAARGLGELLLLQQDAEAAENHYAALWNAHPALERRLALLEPLLALRTEKGTAAAWLDQLKPADATPAAGLSKEDMDRGILWSAGIMLTTRPDRHYPPVLRMTEGALYDVPIYSEPTPWLQAAASQPQSAQWQMLLAQELDVQFRLTAPDEQARELAHQQAPLDEHLALDLLDMSYKESGVYLRTARALKNEIRQKPWLVTASAFQRLDMVKAIAGELDRDVLHGIQDPLWRLIHLLMRSDAGEKPEQLAKEAESLWKAVGPDERMIVRTALPPESNPFGKMPVTWGASSHDIETGCTEPQLQVVWNLRGKSFVATMQARFSLGLQDLASSHHFAPEITLIKDSRKGTPIFKAEDFFATSARLHHALWQHRERLGLKLKLGAPGSQGDTATERLIDVLVRGSLVEICGWINEEVNLTAVRTKWLLACARTIDRRVSTQKSPQKESADETRHSVKTARRKINASLQAQRPSWVIPALRDPIPLTGQPRLNPTQTKVAVSRYGLVLRDEPYEELHLENWRKLLPAITDESALVIEMRNARMDLETDALPHPLWGLQWQPSLKRQRALLRKDLSDTGAVPVMSMTGPRYLIEIMKGQTNPQAARHLPPHMMMSMPQMHDPLLLSLLRCYGTALMAPSSRRALELDAYAARHPLVKDLLTLWQIMPSSMLGVSLSSMDPRMMLTSEQHLDIVKVLEQSTAPDASLTLAVLHVKVGDPVVADRIVNNFKGTNGPLRMLALAMKPPAKAAKTEPPDPEKRKREVIQKAKTVFAEAKTDDDTDTLLDRLPPQTEERRMIYDWLKQEVKTEARFAVQISVMAEMVRRLKLPSDELEAAEQLDLEVNKDNPDVWLRRALSYAKEGKGSWAIDLFLEALRRTRFSEPTQFRSKLHPPNLSWLDRTVAARRTDELASALSTALERTEPDRAMDAAADVMVAVIKSPDTPARPARLKRLLEQIFQQQRHLLQARFVSLDETARQLEQANHKDLATFVARMLLRSTWPERLTHETFQPWSQTNDFPTELHDGRKAWGGEGPEDAGPNGSILHLFAMAMRGEDGAEFVADLAHDAAQFPQDEQLVSCALMARALHAPISAKDWELAAGLRPRKQMRAAWRVCELAPAGHADLAILAPAIAKGLRDLLEKQESYEKVQNYMLAQRVIPWLERAEDGAELRSTLPLLIENTSDDLQPNSWRFVMETVLLHGDQPQRELAARKWEAHCLRMLRRGQLAGWWTAHAVDALSSTVQQCDAATALVLASVANDLWRRAIDQFPDMAGTPGEIIRQLGDALLSTGQADQLKSLVADVTRISNLGSNPKHDAVLRRLLQATDFLEKTGSIPQVQLLSRKLYKRVSGNSAQWRLVIPLGAHEAEPRDTAQAGRKIAPPVFFPAAGKVYKLEILAGEEAWNTRPLASMNIDASSGICELPDLPAAGWLRTVLHDPASGQKSFSQPVVYNLSKPLLEWPFPGGTAKAPQWKAAWVERYGQPISQTVPVEAGATLMLTQGSAIRHTNQNDESAMVNLVALNEKKEPVGTFSDWSGWRDGDSFIHDQLNGGRTSLIKPHEWSSMSGPVRLFHDDPQGDEIKARHLVLTTRGIGEGRNPEPTMLQLFARERHLASALDEPTTLVATDAGTLSFNIKSWHLCEEFPRAVFMGSGNLAVFDTSAVPWKELLHYQSPELADRNTVFMLNPDTVCVMMSAPYPHPEPPLKIRLVHCDGTPNPAKLSDCPSITVPFMPAHYGMPPDERSCLFISGRMPWHMRMAWLDSKLNLKLLKVDWPPQVETATHVAWWPDNSSAVIQQDKTLYHIRLEANVLKLERMEKAPEQDIPLPPNATPGRHGAYQTWRLKDARRMLQLDPVTGSLQKAYLLPAACVGTPMPWTTKNRPILLQTNKHNLILVSPGTINKR